MLNFDVELDLSGINCPVLALKVREAVKLLQSNQVLKVICTDPLSRIDLVVLCDQLKVQLLQVDEQDQSFTFWIQK